MGLAGSGRDVAGRGLSGAPLVLLLTAARLPQLTADDAPLLAAFRELGWQTRIAVWSDPIPDAALAVIRSCWDYTDRPADFLTTITALESRMPLWNPAITARWNADKRYLLELAGRGVAIPPCTVVTAGTPLDHGRLARELGSEQLVVKPVVGASGKGVFRFDRAHVGQEIGEALAGDLLVQRFVPEVVTDGEWSLVYFHGAYSHAVLKRAAAAEFRVQEEHGGSVDWQDPGPRVREAASRALEAVPHPWTYARVDGVVSEGAFLVMEIELIEPSLFLGSLDNARRFAAGVASLI